MAEASGELVVGADAEDRVVTADAPDQVGAVASDQLIGPSRAKDVLEGGQQVCPFSAGRSGP
jgi:hypothetical protein